MESSEKKIPVSNTESPPPPPPPSPAPPEGNANRSSLVELAVKFLNNPRVVDKPIEEKKAFLRKKGLTEAEISTAISKVGVGNVSPTLSFVAPPLPPRGGGVVAPSLHHLLPPRRTWSEYAVMAAVLGGVGYAVLHFVKHYLLPWLRAPKVHGEKLDDINASVKQLQVTVSESLAESTRSLQALLSEQQQHIQLLTTQVTGLQTSIAHLNSTSTGQPLQQIKEEINSLKGILLSRNQFPPTPTRGCVANGTGIPAWQRTLPLSSEAITPTKSGHCNGVVGGDVSHSMENSGLNEATLDLKNGNEETVNGNENGIYVDKPQVALDT